MVRRCAERRRAIRPDHHRLRRQCILALLRTLAPHRSSGSGESYRAKCRPLWETRITVGYDGARQSWSAPILRSARHRTQPDRVGPRLSHDQRTRMGRSPAEATAGRNRDLAGGQSNRPQHLGQCRQAPLASDRSARSRVGAPQTSGSSMAGARVHRQQHRAGAPRRWISRVELVAHRRAPANTGLLRHDSARRVGT